MSGARERRPRYGEGNYELKADLTTWQMRPIVEELYKLRRISEGLYKAFCGDPANNRVGPGMTKVIIIQGGSLESYYEQTLNYLHQKYHQYPTSLPDSHVDPNVMAEVGMYERLARDTAASAPVNTSLPPGKIVL